MKKTRSMLAMLICAALLVSLAVTAFASGETVTSTLDFTTLSPTEDFAAVTDAVKALGAEECSNLVIGDCYNPILSGKGYSGMGYYVQKITAGEGKVFAEAPVLTLNYRLSTADLMGYIKVEGSIDGINYYPFAQITESTGDAWTLECKATTTVVLNGGENAAAVWVRVSMEHWGGPDAAGVDVSTLSATVKEDPNATPVVPANTATSTLDFSQLAIGGTEDMAAAVDAIKALGAVDASNLIVFDCYTKCAAAKGHAGPGYFVQKLDAGEGKIFAEAPVLSLNYRLANADPEGYITIEYSVDGVNFVTATEIDEITGNSYTVEAKATMSVTLTDAVNAGSVWVKVTMEHWGAPDAAAVDASTIRATVTDAPTDPEPTDPQPTEPQPTEPQPTEPQPTEPQPTEPQPTEPVEPEDPSKTGDPFGIFIALLAASGTALVVLKKKN